MNLRDLTGKLQVLPASVRFVEITSVDGKLGAVVFNNNNGEVVVAKPGDREFEMYCQNFSLTPARVIAPFKSTNKS